MTRPSRVALATLLLATACGDDGAEPRQPRADESPSEMAPSSENRETDDPLAALEAPVDPSELVAPVGEGTLPAGTTLDAATPPGGCVALTEAPIRVWPREGIPAIAAAPGGLFYVALHARAENGADEIGVVEVDPTRAPRPVRTIRVEPALSVGRVAPPGLAVDALGRIAVAYVAGDNSVKLAVVEAASAASPRVSPIGEGADPRFSPVVVELRAGRAVAYTDGSGTPMRVRLAVVTGDGAVASRHDLTQQRMGASAPSLASCPGPATMFFVDARSGVSPIVRSHLAPDGTPGESEVARPVGTVATPPEVAVACAGSHAWAAYTAIGNLATTAVGLVAIDGADANAIPLVSGTGYGTLNVSAAGGPHGAVFAADAPKDTPPTAPREIDVRVVRDAPPGEPLVVAGPDGTGHDAAIARRADGVLGLAFASGGAVLVAWLRCDD